MKGEITHCVITCAYFLGEVPLQVLQDVAAITHAELIGAEVDVVPVNRAAIRRKLASASKKAARLILERIDRERILAKMEGMK